MTNRILLVLLLDLAMLLLVCVLECISLTGLTVHEWLGFALCPLVLIHVVMQWPWCVTQFRKIATSSWRDRFNLFLNSLLLVLMSAVLLSGVLTSTQVTSLAGESFGRVGIWREIHGWLNATLVVLVGLHLAVNWNWMIAALRRRRPARPALADALVADTAAVTGRRFVNWAKLPGRVVAVLLMVTLAATAVYFLMAPLILGPRQRAGLASTPPITATASTAERAKLAPGPRSASFPQDLPKFAVTTAFVVVLAIVGRYVFRLRL
jgi:cytochrome b561